MQRHDGAVCRMTLLLLSIAIFLATLVAADAVKDLQDKARPVLDAAIAKSKTCSKEKLRIRREWGDILISERKAYIKAVQCLVAAPPKIDTKKVPGAKNRYDDFVAIHIQQTLNIHGTGSFLSWHRYYTWAWEEALRNECGYNGTVPYWDWGRTAENPLNSPVFDGSDTSMGGNGYFIPGRNDTTPGPPGQGGGCIETGPFENMTANLGPCQPEVYPPPPANPSADCLGYNPRCLRRDMSNFFTMRDAKTSDIMALITNYTDLASFQTKMTVKGVHGAGHFTINGDPGADLYNSPADPAFWLHHSMVDRVWYLWQLQDFANRQQIVAGGTIWRVPDSKNQTLDDPVDLGVLTNKVYKIRELVSTVVEPFCYAYE